MQATVLRRIRKVPKQIGPVKFVPFFTAVGKLTFTMVTGRLLSAIVLAFVVFSLAMAEEEEPKFCPRTPSTKTSTDGADDDGGDDSPPQEQPPCLEPLSEEPTDGEDTTDGEETSPLSLEEGEDVIDTSAQAGTLNYTRWVNKNRIIRYMRLS